MILILILSDTDVCERFQGHPTGGADTTGMEIHLD